MIPEPWGISVIRIDRFTALASRRLEGIGTSRV
jgi:hypothetical protein